MLPSHEHVQLVLLEKNIKNFKSLVKNPSCTRFCQANFKRNLSSHPRPFIRLSKFLIFFFKLQVVHVYGWKAFHIFFFFFWCKACTYIQSSKETEVQQKLTKKTETQALFNTFRLDNCLHYHRKNSFSHPRVYISSEAYYHRKNSFSHPRVYISSEAFHLFLCYELSCQSTGVVGSENPCELQTIFTRLHCRQ